MNLLSRRIYTEIEGKIPELAEYYRDYTKSRQKVYGLTKLKKVDIQADTITLNFERTIGRGVIAISEVQLREVSPTKIYAIVTAKIPSLNLMFCIYFLVTTLFLGFIFKSILPMLILMIFGFITSLLFIYLLHDNMSQLRRETLLLIQKL